LGGRIGHRNLCCTAHRRFVQLRGTTSAVRWIHFLTRVWGSLDNMFTYFLAAVCTLFLQPGKQPVFCSTEGGQVFQRGGAEGPHITRVSHLFLGKAGANNLVRSQATFGCLV
jgi:hypothetical protein